MNSNIPRHAIWRPGMTWDKVGELDPDHRHPMTAGASDPQARLSDMDAMGVDQAFLYPTWFAEGFHLVEDPDVAYALARAYNNWIADFCKAAPDRLFAAAMVPLQNMDLRGRRIAPGREDPLFPRRLHPSDVHRGPLLHPSLSTIRYGRNWKTSASPPRCIRPADCGIPNGPRTGRSSRRSRAGSTSSSASCAPAAGPHAAAAASLEASDSPPRLRLAIRWRRFFRTGWTTTCSSLRP